MKNIRQFVSSFLLLAFGFGVALFSLRSTHVQATYAAGDTIHPNAIESGLDFDGVMNSDMPGSVPYVFLRGWERTQLLWLNPQERAEVMTERIDERRVAAETAWSVGKADQAITTYMKSYGYLHRVTHDCFAPEVEIDCDREDVEQAAQRLIESLRTYFKENGQDTQRAQADGLVAQIHVLLEQFQL